MKKEYRQESKFYRFLLNSSTFFATKLIRIKLHVTGKELLPRNPVPYGEQSPLKV